MANRFDKFSEPAMRALSLAHQEARALGHDHIDTGHLLLGLLAIHDPPIDSLLDDPGVTPEAIRAHLEASAAHFAPATGGTQGLTLDGRRMIELAVEAARRSAVLGIDAEYLLLGILQQPDCVGAEALKHCGLDIPALAAELERRLSEDALDGAGADAPETIELARSELERRGRTPLIHDAQARQVAMDRLLDLRRAVDSTSVGYAKLIGTELLLPEIDFVIESVETGAHTFPGFLELVGEVRHARRTFERLAQLYQRADDHRLSETASQAAAALQAASPLF